MNFDWVPFHFFKRKFPVKQKYLNKWFIAIKYRGKDLFDLNDLSIVQAPDGRYWADPFLIEHNEKTYLFFEDYDYKKGRIGVAEITGLSISNPRIIIDEEKHMSFPSVFKDGDDYFMTPERCQANELLIYRASQFPDKWERFSLVAKGRFDDPIIRKTPNGYQVWANEGKENLRVFQASALSGPWQLVLKEDNSVFSRSAGHFFGDLRPTQDINPVYGRAIKFMKGQEVVRSIEPTWQPNLTGTHTFNFTDKYVVIDGRLRILNSG